MNNINDLNNNTNFKNEYAKLQNNIAPDAEFLEQLAQKMELQKQTQKKQIRKKRAIILVPVLTTVGACAAALAIFLNTPKQPDRPNVKVNTAANTKFSYAVGVFDNKTRLSDGSALPAQLAEMISDSETTVYKSNKNKFDYEDKLDDRAREALAKEIKSAAKTDIEAGKNGDYYMMTLENGDVFKFRISKGILAAENNFYKIP